MASKTILLCVTIIVALTICSVSSQFAYSGAGLAPVGYGPPPPPVIVQQRDNSDRDILPILLLLLLGGNGGGCF